MSGELKRAFVLHRRPFRNTSLLVELFTEGDGRFPTVVRGGAKSRLAGLLQPFVPLRVEWRGRGEVKSLGHFESDDFQLDGLKGRPLYCGLYLNELIMRLIPRYEEHDLLLAAYIRTLSELSESNQVDWLLRQFEYRLLQEIGYKFVLDTTINGDSILPQLSYTFHHAGGFEPVDTNAPGGISGAAIIALQNTSCDDIGLRREAKQLFRKIIDYHLDYKPLKSRELFE